ncbi:MAG: sigma-70 family RNA polymerase sigma factor [Leptolinea sp.]|jgi:RNA polymerase sigma-70 factor (ECF subfamily)|nr:sigma-70 family RNA polymerase sigma factor [Leptolinea sp.]
MADLTEDEALQRAIQGDAEAFSFLYEKYVNKIFSYIYYRTGSTTDAEDLTARVFQRALGRIDRYTQKGVPFSAWLYRIAHNLVANWHRDNSRRQEVALDDQINLVMSGDQPEHQVVDYQEVEKLIEVIQRLTPERQQLVILKFVQQLSNAEIAVIMSKSEGAIKSLYHRTLIELRIKIKEILEQE